MGLDTVELVMDFEEAFNITFPNAEAATLTTPRRVVRYVASRLAPVPAIVCLTQHTFYGIRRGVVRALQPWPYDIKPIGPNPARRGADRTLHGSFRPSARLKEIANKRHWPEIWRQARTTDGATHWPNRINWLCLADLRELTYHVASYTPSPDLSKGEAWTRELIELKVRRIVSDRMNLVRFKLDDDFVRDMGAD